jgi:hypothetical protein
MSISISICILHEISLTLTARILSCVVYISSTACSALSTVCRNPPLCHHAWSRQSIARSTHSLPDPFIRPQCPRRLSTSRLCPTKYSGTVTSSSEATLTSNQILVHVLSLFTTPTLLPLCTISRRFHHLVLRILHFRLLLAAAAPEYKLILEAYHPTKRYTDPYLFCTYLGTDGLSSRHEGEGSLYADCATESGRFAKLSSLYSRFRPERPDIEGSIPVPRGGVSGLTPNSAGVNAGEGSTAPPNTRPIYRNAGDGGRSKIKHNIHLDSNELFGQFCAYANLVRLGPRRGVFLSTIPIVESKQGWMRVWRYWLLDRAREHVAEADTNGNPAGALQRRPTYAHPEDIGNDCRVLWTDDRRNVGLHFEVSCADPRIYQTECQDDVDDMPLIFEISITGKQRCHALDAMKRTILACQENLKRAKLIMVVRYSRNGGAHHPPDDGRRGEHGGQGCPVR